MAINEIEVDVIKIVQKYVTNNKQIEKKNMLKTLGINSVSFIRIIVELEEFFEIDFDDDSLNLSRFKTVKALIYYISDIIESHKP